MKRRTKEPQAEGNTAEWMTTYSDMVTLLFTFFVLLFAISQVDVQKWNLLVASLSNKGAPAEVIVQIADEYNLKNTEAIDPTDPRIALEVETEAAGGVGADGSGAVESAMVEAYTKIQDHINQSGLGDKVMVTHGSDYIFIRAIDDMLFGPNSAEIRQQDYELLNAIGQSLLTIEANVGMIRVDGHTAAIPEQEDYPVSDRDLSSARANAVLKYFENVVGLHGDKLSTAAFGKYRPIASNDVEETRRRNRRIEILVTHGNHYSEQLDTIYATLTEVLAEKLTEME